MDATWLEGDVDGAKAEGDQRAEEDEQAEHGPAHRQPGIHARLTVSLKRGKPCRPKQK